jgi:hypothetical protein
LLVVLAGSVVCLRQIEQLRTGANLPEVLYISSPQTLKKLGLGYNGLLADIYWTRAVQYFGSRHHEGARRYDLLAPLLEITTALDPQLMPAYEYGASFLAPPPPYGAGMPDKAVALEEYGIRHNPDQWNLYYQLGFIYASELKDYAKAAHAFERGSELPNAHPWLKLLAAQMAEHGGDWQTARLLWTTTYETTNDKDIKANAVAHLRALKVDEDVAQLENAAALFHERDGRWPESFAQMQQAGLLRGTPVDPLGHPYKLEAEGKVVLADPDQFPFVSRGLPEGYVAVPLKFPSKQ